MNINLMPAGKEMDVLIDHKIFGRKWKRVTSICLNGTIYHGNYWVQETDDPMNLPSGYRAIPSGPPPHSTNDTVALQLLKHMRSLRYSYTISSIGGQTGVTCIFWGGPSLITCPEDGYHATAFTLALATSRAALKAATIKDNTSMIEKPVHTVEAIEGSTTQHLLRLEIVTLDKYVFEQIEYLPISCVDQLPKIAEREAIAIVIALGDVCDLAWLIGQGEHRLWRTTLGPSREFSHRIPEYPFLLTLPQVFLIKSRRKKGA